MTIPRWVTLTLVGVALAGAGVLGWIAYLAEARSDRLLAAAGRVLGRELTAERVGVVVGRTVGVGLWGVRIADDPAFGSDEPFVVARRIEMRVRLLPLLRGRLIVDRVVVDEPVVRLVRAADGRLNFDSLRQQARANKKQQKDGPDAAERPHAGAAFQVALLAVRAGTVRFQDQETGHTLELRDLVLDAEQPHLGAPIPVTVRTRFEATDVRFDGITSEGVLDLATEGAWYFGTVHVEQGTVGPFTFSQAEARAQLRPPTALLERMRVKFLGSEITGYVRVQSGGEGVGIRAEIDGRDLDLEQLPVAAGRPRPAGKLSMHVSLAGPVPGAGDFRQALRGSGRFEVAQGRITNLRLGTMLRDVLGPFLGAEKTERLRTRYPDLFGGDDLLFTAFSGSGLLKEGRIRSEDFVLAGASYQTRGSGTLGLDGGLDVTLRLLASAALTDDLVGKGTSRAALVDDQGRLVVPLHVGGTLDHPKVTPEAEFAGQVARNLLGGTGLEKAAGAVIEKLLSGKKRRQK